MAGTTNRIGGILAVKVDGEMMYITGNVTYSLGKGLRAGVAGHDQVHGYTEVPQVPYIEGEFTFRPDVDLEAIQDISDATITCELANSKTVVLRKAWYASEGVGNSESGAVAFRFEGMSAELI